MVGAAISAGVRLGAWLPSSEVPDEIERAYLAPGRPRCPELLPRTRKEARASALASHDRCRFR